MTVPFTPQRAWDVVIIAGQSNAGLPGDLADLSAADKKLQLGTRQWDSYLNNDTTVIQQSTHVGFARPNHATNFGAALEFARAMHAVGRNIATCTISVYGTGLASRWLPVDTGLYGTQLVPAVTAMLAELPVAQVRGLVWIQGETDAGVQVNAEAYAANMTTLVAKLRTDYGPNLPVVLNRLHVNSAETYTSTVRAQQVAWVAGDAHTAWFDVDDLALKVDNVHFPSASLVTLAQRAAAALGPML